MNQKMLARLKSAIFNKDKLSLSEKTMNVNEEYLSAIRTKSYAGIQLILDESPEPETLLDPDEEAIATILDFSSCRPLLADFFKVSAAASRFCTDLLRGLNLLQSDFHFLRRVIDGSVTEPGFSVLRDPFSSTSQIDFDLFHRQHAAILRRLKSRRAAMARRIRLIKCFNRTSGVCLGAACGIAAAAAAFIAIHTLGAAALLMGPPAIIGFPPTRQKVMKFGFVRSRILRRSAKQVDAAAKGAYILKREFDTLSRLVGRVRDEMERGKGLVRLCMEHRRRETVVRELRIYEMGLRSHVTELEEHVFLCLLTINRVRTLVVNQICAAVVY